MPVPPRPPSPTSSQASVLVVGGGVIGLSCAWRLPGTGTRSPWWGPDPAGGTAPPGSRPAVAPVTEVQIGEAALTELLLEGAGGRRLEGVRAAQEACRAR